MAFSMALKAAELIKARKDAETEL
jgi:hypothetical protein